MHLSVLTAALCALSWGSALAVNKEAAAAGATPPYAVSMEPMVPYSQRDPLYHMARHSTQRRHAVAHAAAPHAAVGHLHHVQGHHVQGHHGPPGRGAKNRRDAGAYGAPPPPYEEYGPAPEHHEYPEPIIEIIIKESNESLPAPPPPVLAPKKPTREPVHVFYVKYKQTGSGEYGKDGNSGVVFDDPIPALTPAPPPEEEEEHDHQHQAHYEEAVTPAAPRQTTTLRAIIHPDSELAHPAQGSEGKLRVTFGGPHDDEAHARPSAHTQHGADDKHDQHDKQDGHEEGESAQQPVAAFPAIRFPEQADHAENAHHIKRSQQQPAPHLQQTGFNSAPPAQAPLQHPPPPPPGHQPGHQHFQQGRYHQDFPPYRGQFGPPPPPPGPLRGPPPPPPQKQQHQPAFLRPQPSLDALQNPRYPPFAPPPPPFGGQEQFRPRPAPGDKPQRPFQHDSFRPNYFPQPQPPPAAAPSRPPPPPPQPQFVPSTQHPSRPTFQHQQHQQPPRGAFQPQPHQVLREQHQQQVLAQPQPHQVLREQHQQQVLAQQQQQALLRQQQEQQHRGQTHFAPQHGQHGQHAQHAQFAAPQQQFSHQQPQPSFTPQQPQPSFAPQQQQSFTPHQQQPQPQQQAFTPQQPSQQQLYREQQLKQQALLQQQQQQQQQQHHQQQQQQEQQQFAPSQGQQAHSLQQSQRDSQRETLLGAEIVKSIPQSEEHVLLNQGPFGQTQTLSHSVTHNQQQQQQQNHQQQHHQQQQPHHSVQVLSSDQDGPRVTFSSSTPSYSGSSAGNSFATPSPPPSFSLTPSSTTPSPRPSPRPTPRPTTTTTTTTTEEPAPSAQPTTEEPKVDLTKKLAELPDEVPDDIREQLIASGILGNADIQILDYDKIGDTSIDALPQHALENFYANGGGQASASEPVASVVAPPPQFQPRQPADAEPVDAEPSASDVDEVVQEPATVPQASNVEMKVVRYDPATAEGQQVADQYLKKDAAVLNDPVVLNDNRYNRYLPLKISGAAFPLPDAPLLRGRNVTSVVVLAPVDYDFLQAADDDAGDRVGRAVEVHGVRFVAGDALKKLVRTPTQENYRLWLQQERQKPLAKQSVILLVTSPTADADAQRDKEIFMYDASSDEVSRLTGELSSSFVEVAESNALSQDLENVDVEGEGASSEGASSEAKAEASERQEVRVAPPEGFFQRRADDAAEDAVGDMDAAASDPVTALFRASPAASQDAGQEVPQVAISSGYARTSTSS